MLTSATVGYVEDNDRCHITMASEIPPFFQPYSDENQMKQFREKFPKILFGEGNGRAEDEFQTLYSKCEIGIAWINVDEMENFHWPVVVYLPDAQDMALLCRVLRFISKYCDTRKLR
jgi:hypothetical protein